MKPAVCLALLVVATTMGCGGNGSPPGDPRVADQEVLERAHARMLADCRATLRVEPRDITVRAANIVARHPDRQLPNGQTPRMMADRMVAAVKRCGTLDAEAVELWFVSPGG